MVTLLARPLSLALRLFGNLYAGELIFFIDCDNWFIPVASTLFMGSVPLAGYPITSVYFHDANDSIFESSSRRSLIFFAPKGA